MANTIKMQREDGKTADVHPDEVENYRAGGFEPADKADPLDHDGDGKKGGSPKGEQSTAAKGAAARKTRKAK